MILSKMFDFVGLTIYLWAYIANIRGVILNEFAINPLTESFTNSVTSRLSLIQTIILTVIALVYGISKLTHKLKKDKHEREMNSEKLLQEKMKSEEMRVKLKINGKN